MTASTPAWKAVYESERAERYDDFIEAAAMNYRGALDAVITMAGRTPRPVRRILELGAGTGLLTELALRRFGEAEAVAVDGSEKMLARAAARLLPFADRARVRLSSFEQLDGSDLGEFDLVLSSFALHHMDHGRLRALLARLRGALRPGGQLVIADYVLSRSARLQGWYEETWVEHRLGRGGFSAEDKARMMREHEATKAAEGDNPAALADLLAWTCAAGFVDVDCHWKHYCYAVYGGLR